MVALPQASHSWEGSLFSGYGSEHWRFGNLISSVGVRARKSTYYRRIQNDLELMTEDFPEKWYLSWDLKKEWASVRWREWWCDSRKSDQHVQKCYAIKELKKDQPDWSPEREGWGMMGEESREVSKDQIMWVVLRVLDSILRAMRSHWRTLSRGVTQPDLGFKDTILVAVWVKSQK